jgi:integrase
MSVYRRHGAETYSYDFRLQGHRFSGDTGETEKRKAQAHERLKRAEAAAQVAEGIALDKPATWELASSRYWLEVGQHHRNADTTLKSLAWLTRHIGRETRLEAIDDNFVAGLVAHRRMEDRPGIKDLDRQRKIGPATVNRTMTEPLRKVLLRAQKVWKVKVGDIAWRTHMLAEPKERVREASRDEEAAILAQLERGYEDAVKFGILSGCRRKEICGLRWTDVDFFNRQFAVTGKGDKRGIVPMSAEIHAMLWRKRDEHPEFVFSFVAQKTRRELGQVRGRRYPIKEGRLTDVMQQAIKDAGVTNFRLHDTRHTAATRVLRASNLKVVQNLLRHEDIATTAKYAHAMTEDIRAALDAASAANATTGNAAGRFANDANDLEKKG